MNLSIPRSIARAAVMPPRMPADIAHIEPSVQEISFSRLHGETEIASIRHLRDDIELPPAVRDAPEFRYREKKGMSTARSACSGATAGPSGLSGSFRWVWVSHLARSFFRAILR